jgi:hypothetical protein
MAMMEIPQAARVLAEFGLEKRDKGRDPSLEHFLYRVKRARSKLIKELLHRASP